MVLFASHIRVKDWKYISAIIRLNLTLFNFSPLKESNVFIKKRIRRNIHHTAGPILTGWYSQDLAQSLHFVVWVPLPSGRQQWWIRQRACKGHTKPAWGVSLYSSALERELKFTCTKHCSHIEVWGKRSLEWNLPHPKHVLGKLMHFNPRQTTLLCGNKDVWQRFHLGSSPILTTVLSLCPHPQDSGMSTQSMMKATYHLFIIGSSYNF